MAKKDLKEKIQEKVEPQPTSHPIPTVSKPEFHRRRYAFRVLLLGITVLFAILTVLAKQDPYFPFDLQITLDMQKINIGWFDFLMKTITFFGYAYMVAILVAIGSGYLFFKGRRLESIVLAFSTFGAVGVGEMFKTLVARARPSPTLVHQFGHFIRKDSFPSGHVLFYVGYFGFILFLAFTLLPKKWYRTVAIIFCAVMMALVGPSRIYLGAHWFSDTLGAYLLGFLWLVLSVYLYNRFNPKTKPS